MNDAGDRDGVTGNNVDRTDGCDGGTDGGRAGGWR